MGESVSHYRVLYRKAEGKVEKLKATRVRERLFDRRRGEGRVLSEERARADGSARNWVCGTRSETARARHQYKIFSSAGRGENADR